MDGPIRRWLRIGRALPYSQTMSTIEEHIAHLTRTVEDLSDVIARQEREIATLAHRVQLLLEREAERQTEGGGGVIIGDERPPHW